MAVDQIDDHLPLSAFDVAHQRDTQRAGAVPPRTVGDGLPRVVVASGSTHAIEELLLAVASGDREAFVALRSCMGDLVRVNIRRVLRDASRSDAVTEEFFAEVLRDAISFDPDQDSARTWLLTRAHQRAMNGLGSGPSAARERSDVTTSIAGSAKDRDRVGLADHPVHVSVGQGDLVT